MGKVYGRKKDFFISYNKADKERAKWVAKCLNEVGKTTHIQAWGIRQSDNFIAKMNEFLENSSAFIAILSENYFKSPYCNLEWSAALDKNMQNSSYRFIPIRVAEVTVPDLIRTIVYFDIFNIDEEVAKKRILNAIDPNPIIPSSSKKEQKVLISFPTKLPPNNLPHSRNPYFTGRDEILEQIHNNFQNKNSTISLTAIKGLGGIGKSSIALEYAYRYWRCLF